MSKFDEKITLREESKYQKTKFYENFEDFPLEREQNLNGTFNYEQRALEDGCCSDSDGAFESVNATLRTSIQKIQPDVDVGIVNGPLPSDKLNEAARDFTFDEHTYENLTYEKELLLHKFFCSRNAIYENLCRGCGYGVFEAHGELCFFCASIVNGVRDTPNSNLASALVSNTDLDFINASNNIYENICEKCYTIYSNDVCEFCDLKSVKSAKNGAKNLTKNQSNDELTSKSANIVKVAKSKSFNKRTEKRGLFQGFIGSLKRASKSPKAVSASKLEIIHNVDGYDHVFRTQETFDLQRICELKQVQKYSNSEQHIYGRLKCGGLPEVSHSNSTQTLPLPKAEAPNLAKLSKADSDSSFLNCQTSSIYHDNNSESNVATKSSSPSSVGSGKRPRISKPRLLRAITSAKQKNDFSGKTTNTKTQAAADEPDVGTSLVKQQQSLYLADSVCNWMTSLRREIHNYHNLGDDLCNPKSIPAKQCLIGYNAGNAGANYGLFINVETKPFVTNTLNIGDVIGKSFIQQDSTSNSDVSSVASLESSSCAHDESITVTLRSKQAIEQVFEFDEQHAPVDYAQMVNEFMRGLLVKQARELSRGMESDLKESKRAMEILERRELNAKRQAQRAKRQAIYLKNHEIHEMSNANNNSETRDADLSTADNKHTSSAAREYEKNFVMAVDTNYTNKQNQKTQNDSKKVFEAELSSTAQNSESSPVSRRRTATACSEGDLNKRCGVYDFRVEAEFVGGILSDFDTYLQHEEAAIAAAEAAQAQKTQNTCESLDSEYLEEAQQTAAYREAEKGSEYDPFGAVIKPLSAPTVALQHQQQRRNQLINFMKLVEELQLSRSLHRIIIDYEQPLHAFLKAIHSRYSSLYAKWPKNRLNKKYKRFHKYCIEKKITKTLPSTIKFKKFGDSTHKTTIGQGSEIKKDFKNVSTTIMAASGDDALNAERNSIKIIVQQVQIQSDENKTIEMVTTIPNTNERNQEKLQKSYATNETFMASFEGALANGKSEQITRKPHRMAPKKLEPPQVPQRDPKTALSTKILIKHNQTESQTQQQTVEENIYHPIWNFKTVGEVPERYQTDADYYEIDDDGNVRDTNIKAVFTATKDQLQNLNADTDSLASLANSTGNDIEEDHGEWETDDEFMFATEISAKQATMQRNNAADAISLNSSQAASMQSTSSLSAGSTVAGFSSSLATLASGISASLTHQLLRNICIFYSLTEPKLRAIIYDYDRVHAFTYFAKQLPQRHPSKVMPPKADSPCSNDSNESNANDSGIGKSPKAQRSPMPPPRTSSIAKGPPCKLPPKKSSESGCQAAKLKSTTTTTTPTANAKTPQLVPDSVLAWKFMLLDVNYLEDEEDMIVSEAEILRAQQIKEDNDTRQTQQLNILQRFKSASFGNLVDLPDEDEKIGISSAIDRMRNKLQRGVFKINVRSPKSDKKNRGVFRRAEATSLYLEDGMKPKYPIFGAPLEQVELDQVTYYNVPRFVVDAVAYIEQNDCILQEGLYRASGNQVSVEELKQKLSESYIYDPKLIVTDDIHTLTSLLKKFFRELGAPLIPQDIYERLARNLNDEAGIESIRNAFEDLQEPNRSTLKFLIKHLTNVAAYSSQNRMPASNLAIVWGPCILSANQIEFDIGRMNTLAKVLIENYAQIFNESERLVA